MSKTELVPVARHRPFPGDPLTVGMLRRMLDSLEAQGARPDDGVLVGYFPHTVEFSISAPRCPDCGHLPHEDRQVFGKCHCGCLARIWRDGYHLEC